jgi:hypothetical protein
VTVDGRSDIKGLLINANAGINIKGALIGPSSTKHSPGVDVLLLGGGSLTSVTSLRATGPFTIGPIKPGRYLLQVVCAGCAPSVTYGGRPLVNETLDLDPTSAKELRIVLAGGLQ